MISFEGNNFQSSSKHNLVRPDILPVFATNMFLSVLFLKALNLCSSLTVSDQISHPYKTANNVATSLFDELNLFAKVRLSRGTRHFAVV
jgi:hypothetical protein